MGIVSEDGTVTGSVDVNQLDEIEPKTDEARAQIDALKAEVAQGQEQTQADAERLNEQQVEANPLAEDASKDDRDVQGVQVSDQPAGEHQSAQAEGQSAQPEGQPAQAAQPEAQPAQ